MASRATREGTAPKADAPQRDAARRVARKSETPAPSPAGAISRATGVGPQRAAALGVAGNSALRRVVAGSAPVGPQRLWSRDEFGKRTYESIFTSKSHAQKAVEELITQYYAIESDRPTPVHASLLAQMKSAAEFWINDHSITDEEGTATDPARPKRMQGFKDFLTSIDGELAVVKNVLGTKFSPDILEPSEAYTQLAERYKGTADSLFTKAAFLIDKGVSTPGDSAKINIEFELPVDPSGAGFIGGRLTVEASRDDAGMVKARSEIVVTGGAKVGVAKLKAEMGGYIEAQAGSATEVMNLYSYGLYRRFRESNAIPSGMTNYLWGGSRGDYGKKKAEAWSRDLEKRLFELVPLPDQNDPKYASLPPKKKKRVYEEDLATAQAAQDKVRQVYVETGGIVAGKGQVGLSKVAEMTIGIQYTSGRKIDADSIVAAKGAAGAANQKGSSFGQKALGADTSSTKGSIELKLGPMTGSMAISASGEDRKIEFEVGGKIPASAADGVAAYLADIAVKGVKFYRALKASESKTEGLGPLVAFASLQKSLVITPVQGVIEKKGPMGAVGDVGLKFAASMERKGGTWSGELELKHVSDFDKDLTDALKVQLEKTSRLAKWSYSGGNWASS